LTTLDEIIEDKETKQNLRYYPIPYLRLKIRKHDDGFKLRLFWKIYEKPRKIVYFTNIEELVLFIGLECQKFVKDLELK
jgi:hypothetical protein